MRLTPRSLVHNWRLKLTALGLSVFLWALVQTEPRNAETFSPVPVLVEVTDTAWALAGMPEPAQVELRLSGPAREMVRLARSGTSVRVPVPDVGSPDTVVNLRRDWVALEEGSRLIVESVSPSSVRLAFDSAVTRAVPVAARTSGVLPEGLALASPVGVNPPMARLRGPASRLEGVDSVLLGVLDLSTVTASGVVDLAVDTAGLSGIRVSPGSATVGVRVEERVERTLTGIVVIAQAGVAPWDITVTPAEVDVVLRGARTLVNAVDPMDLRAYVVLEGLSAGEERRVAVGVEGVPALVEWEVAPEIVTVRRSSVPEAPGGPR